MLQSFVCIDLETTGLCSNENEIIEIGAVKVVQGVVTEKFSTLIKPKGKIDEFVSDLTGIDLEMVQNAPEFHDIEKKLCDLLQDQILIAHNAQFDINMLNQAFKRLGKSELTNIYLDTKELSTIIYPNLYSHKLGSLSRHFHLNILDHHRALNDALCVAYLFLQMEEDVRKMNPLIIAEALRLIPSSNKGLKTYLEPLYKEIYKGQSLHYKDYLHSYKKTPPIKQEKNIDFDMPHFFSEQSCLKDKFQSFEVRASQQKMSEFIWNCLTHSEHGIVEAGTGTGKSLAYLIPAIFWARKEATPVIISTRTKHLQNQLVEQEIPKLQSILPHFSYCVVKGKENYIDVEKFDELYQEYATGLIVRDVIEFLGLLSWIIKTETGDLSELHPNILSRFNQRIHFTNFSESHKKTKVKEKCFVAKMRKKAKDADIIITNHSLVFSDIISKAGILPEYNYIIFDEAHHIEESATSSFSVQVTNLSIAEAMTLFIGKNHEPYLQNILSLEDLHKVSELFLSLKQANERFFNKLDQLFKEWEISQDTPKKQIRITPEVRQSASGINVEKELDHFLLQINPILDLLESLIGRLKENSQPDIKEFVFKVTASQQMLLNIKNNFQFIFANQQNNQLNYVSWIESEKNNNRKWYKCIAAPLDCSIQLAQALCSQKRSIIMTSATLTVQGSFQYFLSQIGITLSEKPYQTLILPSEFNYKQQADFYILKDIPSFSETKESHQVMSKIISEIVRKEKGKALILFTSYKTLKSLYYLLKNDLKDINVTVYSQHLHGSRESILERFKAEIGRAVLLGVDSFWEGIDLPGNQLTSVIIQKLPFHVPTEPIHSARMEYFEEKGGSGFMDYMLPLALLKFRQGIGRLIRSRYDTGSILVLDHRLSTKSYGKHFLKEVAHYNIIETNMAQLN